MAKSKLGKNEAWGPCDDCIDPIADALDKLVPKHGYKVGCALPHVGIIALDYRVHHLDFLIAWLEINISVEYAHHFDAKLRRPLREYVQLNQRAYELKPRDDEGPTWASGDVVSPLLSNWHKQLRELSPKERKAALGDENSPLVEIENELRTIYRDLQCLAPYLRQVSAVLRAKMADKEIKRADVPPDMGPMTETMTQTEIAKWFDIHRNQVRAKILDNDDYYHEKVGSQYRLRVLKMPPKYHAHHVQDLPVG